MNFSRKSSESFKIYFICKIVSNLLDWIFPEFDTLANIAENGCTRKKLIYGIQSQHHSWNVKCTCYCHDMNFKWTDFFTLYQNERCVSLLTIHCIHPYVAWYIVIIMTRHSLIFATIVAEFCFSNVQCYPCLCIKPRTTIQKQHIELSYNKYHVVYSNLLYR